MQRRCELSGEPFEITAGDLAFYDKMSPLLSGRSFTIPPPRLSPVERQRRRLSFRNLRHLYHRTCDLSGRKIISCYPPESRHTVYHSEMWWSDKWDGIEYGRDFDFSRPFFDQFADLYRAVPLIHLYQTPNENCEFVNGASNCRNCYLSFLMDYCEECYYLTNGKHCRSCIDGLALTECELCFECVDCSRCYGLHFSTRCSDCSDSAFLTDCRQCRRCIGCVNLVGKEHYIYNQKSSAEQYRALMAELQSWRGTAELLARAQSLSMQHPKRCYFGHSNESFSGDALQNTKNAYWCFDSFELENCKHCNYVFRAHDCMDLNLFGDHAEWIYECLASGIQISQNAFCMFCWSGSSFNYYCHLISGCSNCFGCSGLRRKQYCIFNKQYSKDEYEALAARIILHMQQTAEWGEFFPSRLSPFPVNLSQTQEYLPLTQAEAMQRGLSWQEPPSRAAGRTEFEPPDTLKEVDDGILGRALGCRSCKKSYKIIEQELRFYRQAGLAPPRLCPECRHSGRETLRNRRVLHARACSQCGKSIDTTWPSDAGALLIYCEECYQREVF
jgi:hypothetical protein